MATARGRKCFASWEFNVNPVVCLDVEDRNFVCASALTETAKDYHLSTILLNNSRVLISVRNWVTSGLDLGPTHSFEVQIMQLTNKSRFVRFELCRFVVVTAKEVHIILKDN